MDAALATQTLETLETWLAEALQAKHKALTFKVPVYLGHAGVQRSYSMDTIGNLDTYISELSQAIAAKKTGKPGRGPFYTMPGIPS